MRVSVKKLRQSASATARWEAERKAAAQVPLLYELDGEYAGAGSRLVDVEVYAEEKVLRRRGTGRVRARAMGIDYLSRKPAGSCDKLYCKCGPALGCFKQHVTTFRLKQVREPIGFRLIAPRARRVCVQSTEPLRYQLDDLTRQRIAASLDIV